MVFEDLEIPQFSEFKPVVVDSAVRKNAAKWRERNKRRAQSRKAAANPPTWEVQLVPPEAEPAADEKLKAKVKVDEPQVQEPELPEEAEEELPTRARRQGKTMPGGYYVRSLEEVHRNTMRAYNVRLTKPYQRQREEAEEIPPLEPEPEVEGASQPSRAARAAAQRLQEKEQEAQQAEQQRRVQIAEEKRKEAEKRLQRRMLEAKICKLREQQEAQECAQQEIQRQKKQREEEARQARQAEEKKRQAALDEKRKAEEAARAEEELRRKRREQKDLLRDAQLREERKRRQEELAKRERELEEQRRREEEERKKKEKERKEQERKARQEARLAEERRRIQEEADRLEEQRRAEQRAAEAKRVETEEEARRREEVEKEERRKRAEQRRKDIKEKAELAKKAFAAGLSPAAAASAAASAQAAQESTPEAQLTVAVLGHQGSGKTTLVGALMLATGLLSERDLVKRQKDLERNPCDFLQREDGLRLGAVELALLDVPGGRRCLPQAVAAAAEADVALLAVSARGKELEAALREASGSSALAEQLRVAKGLGASRLVVAITKMEDAQWSQDRFDEVVAKLSPVLTSAGFSSSAAIFEPVDGLGNQLDAKKMEEVLRVFRSLVPSGASVASWCGAVLSSVDRPVQVSQRLKASLEILELPRPLTAGFRAVLHVHAATVEVEVEKIIDAFDWATGVTTEKPKMVKAGQRLTVTLHLSREVPLSESSDGKGNRLSLLMMRLEETTVATGYVLEAK
ncbi:unnamed protein product [Effrenium voratum]|nr:unnamed protein product [Effrenium voratum]